MAYIIMSAKVSVHLPTNVDNHMLAIVLTVV